MGMVSDILGGEMSATERLTDTIGQLKAEVYAAQAGFCWYCQEPMKFMTFELAHRAPQRKWLIEKWGSRVIHHPRNVVGTHPGYCNGRAQLDPNSLECDEHLAAIRKEIESAKDNRG
jgi:hypothetical protein